MTDKSMPTPEAVAFQEKVITLVNEHRASLPPEMVVGALLGTALGYAVAATKATKQDLLSLYVSMADHAFDLSKR